MSVNDASAVEFARHEAHLSSIEDQDPPYIVSGIAIGEDDVTLGQSGVRKKWPREALKPAAESLEGRPLVVDHENGSYGVVGEVVRVKYQDNVGILYEAELDDEELAEKIANGRLEVSIRGFHPDEENLDVDPDTGAKVIPRTKFDNLSIVPTGAAPSNSVTMGGISDGEVVASAGPTVESGPSTDLTAAECADIIRSEATSQLSSHDMSVGDWVQWGSRGGDVFGKIRKIVTDSTLDDEIKGSITVEGTEDDPAAKIQIYDPDKGEFEDTYVGHKLSTLESWTPEENAEEVVLEEHDVDDVYQRWDEHVNMSASELEKWAEHPCSNIASKDPEAVRKRNMMLLETPKDEWGKKEVDAAKRTISFISRMRGQRPDNPSEGGKGTCPSEWAVSLLNWAYNPFDGMPEGTPNPDEEENAETVAEELETSMHKVSFSGTTDSEWNEPSLEDITDKSWDELSDEEKRSIGEHFFVSVSGWLAENFGDLKLPAVEPSGELNLNALDSVYKMAEQTDGVSSEEAGKIKRWAVSMAEEYFDVDWSDRMAENADGSRIESDEHTSPHDDADSQSRGAGSDEVPDSILSDATFVKNMTEDELSDYDDPHVLEGEDLEALREKANKVDELEQRFEELESDDTGSDEQTSDIEELKNELKGQFEDDLEELKDRTRVLDKVDRSNVEELAEHDSPMVVEASEFEELQETVDEVREVYAEALSDHIALDAETIEEKFGISEMKDQLEDLSEADDATEELSPDLKGDDPEEDDLEEAAEGQPDDSPDEDVEAKQEKLRERILS